jgi:16S rRNA (guanine966-N2)-methyltransferase
VPDAGRVITGSAGGLRLAAPRSGTRPLSDKVKQALFAILGSTCPGAWEGPFLDLFAGSGAAGIEALSRGAPAAVFVETDPGAARIIEENLRRTGLAGATLVRKDAVAWLAAGPPPGLGSFAGVLIDPPYDRPDLAAACLEHLGAPATGWLRDDACVVVKHFWRTAPPPGSGRLRLVRARRFGETALSVFRLADGGGRPADERAGGAGVEPDEGTTGHRVSHGREA